jgi:GH25 family lysozyme M1 (1,4-beta-N-acetylmuramidase)
LAVLSTASVVGARLPGSPTVGRTGRDRLVVAPSATGAAHAAAAATLATEARFAQTRLPANLSVRHPGRPESITHPDADHMGSQDIPRRPATQAPASLMAAERPDVLTASSDPEGLDVSSYQGNVNWAAAAADGAAFAYMKATEGAYYVDSAYFAQQYNGSYNAGLIRGAYHFAIPSNSTGAAQADYFVAHGGGWSADGKTLPGTLDIEYNPYGSECYGLTPSQMVSWIGSFDREYHLLTGREPTIYTNTNWWQTCTGNSAAFSQEGLAIARYGSSNPYPLPASWGTYQIWQYADSGVFPGDQDLFNGLYEQLIQFAYGYPVIASSVPLQCGTGGDLRTPTEATVEPGVVVASVGTYATDTVDASGQLQAIPTSAPSPSTLLVAVWQNSTDCTGSAASRNAWAVAPNGAVYGESAASGPTAANFGDPSNIKLVRPVVGMSPTSDAAGYWLVAGDGGIFSYGDARFHGSTGGVKLVQAIVGMATTGDSAGYWLVASDGGIFAFGDAGFHGSLGGIRLVKPIEAMVATPDGKGYWMVASDGGVFCFGDAVFRGSMGNHALSAPIAGMIPNGSGYTLIGEDGHLYPFA